MSATESARSGNEGARIREKGGHRECRPLTLDLDTIDTDAPLFDPAAFGLGDEEAGLNALARRLGRTRFAPRAAAYDRDARFPTENYADLGEHGLFGICIPKAEGGLGAGFRAYCTTAAEIGRYCAATALTWNMHTCTCLWTGALADDLDMARDAREQHRRRRALHYRRVVAEGALYAQPFSEGGTYDGTARMTPFSTVAERVAGGWRINGRKIFASLAGAADYYGILCGEAGSGLNRRPAATRCISRCPPMPRASRSWASGIRWACAARSRAPCCSRMSSSTTTPP